MMQENEIKDSNENIIYNLKTRKKFFSKLTEEETNIFLKNLNLDENILNELENIVKNGQDLISIYNNNQLLEKINLDLHSKNIINSAIEEALEEQLKINIEIENGKNIILNIENEPKYELKEIYAYLELLLKKKVFLCPKNSPKEILNPNTFIYKKIILNPDKYCNLSIFDEYFLTKNNEEKNNLNNNINNKNDMNININMNKTPDLNIEKKEIINKGGYNSLFQMKKKNPISDFTTEYQMPNFNKSNDININNNKDFKYQNILSNKDKEKDINNKLNINLENNNNLNINNNLNNNKEQQKIKFNNAFNIINNTDSNINKNYFTQRNFAPKNFSQTQNELNDNGEIFSKITDFKIIDRTKNANNNNYIEKEKENNLENINNKNKTENRYEYVKYQELDIFKNKNMYNNNPKPPQEMQQKPVNDINNLILKTQTTNIPPMKNKIDDSDDILKSLREKYSLQNNNNVEEKRDYKDSKMDFTNDYKPKTPIAEGRRTFNNDSMKFNFMDENSNDPLENKFLNINRQNKKEDFDKYNFLNKNINNPFNNNKEIDEQNKGYMNIGKMRTNRPSPGLDFNNFQYKTTDYKNSFGQNMEGNEGGDELNEEN